MVAAERDRSHCRRILLHTGRVSCSSTDLRGTDHRPVWQVRSSQAEQDDGEVPRPSLLQTRVHRATTVHLQWSGILLDPFTRRAVRSRRGGIRSERRTRGR